MDRHKRLTNIPPELIWQSLGQDFRLPEERKIHYTVMQILDGDDEKPIQITKLELDFYNHKELLAHLETIAKQYPIVKFHFYSEGIRWVRFENGELKPTDNN
jgi:hypothetical protein